MEGWPDAVKKAKKIERLEALSEESLSLQQVNDVVEDGRIWKDFWKTIRKVEGGGHINKEEKNLCVTVVLVMLLFKNWQRPGAVVNLKLKEYRQAKPVMEGGSEVLVIPVHDHKTQGKGPANVSCEGEDIKVLRRFHNVVRPFCDTENACPYFFTLDGERRISNANYYIQKLGRQYGLDIPTATRVRKIGSTAAVQSCSAAESTLLSTHMGHSQPTQQMYYQAITARKHAASAHMLREKLRKSTKPESSDGSSEAEVQSKPHKVRKPFSSAETASIDERFAKSIKDGITPSRQLCQEFITATKSDRDPKQIQDKVRNIIKQRK